MSYALVLPDPLDLAHKYASDPSKYASVTGSDDHTVMELYQLHLDALEDLEDVEDSSVDALEELNCAFWESLSILEQEDRTALANRMTAEDAYSELLAEDEMAEYLAEELPLAGDLPAEDLAAPYLAPLVEAA
jgi:hypothetical protein